MPLTRVLFVKGLCCVLYQQIYSRPPSISVDRSSDHDDCCYYARLVMNWDYQAQPFDLNSSYEQLKHTYPFITFQRFHS